LSSAIYWSYILLLSVKVIQALCSTKNTLGSATVQRRLSSHVNQHRKTRHQLDFARLAAVWRRCCDNGRQRMTSTTHITGTTFHPPFMQNISRRDSGNTAMKNKAEMLTTIAQLSGAGFSHQVSLSVQVADQLESVLANGDIAV